MNQNLLITILLICNCGYGLAQTTGISGKVTNSRLEPLAFVSIQIRELKLGTVSKEDGSYQLMTEQGKYDLVFSMVGYQPRIVTIIAGAGNTVQNIILEAEDSRDLEEVVVRGRIKDHAEDIIRNVIRNKEKILDAAAAYSCLVYIKATQQDSSAGRQKKKTAADTARANADLLRMAMAEISLRYDYENNRRNKEERLGVTKRGNADGLFYLTNTDGDFNFYNNLIKAPALSESSFLSPLSYSGLLAYRFRTIKIETKGNRKFYTIGVKPGKLSNATVEGELTVSDSSWAIVHTRFVFPKYHLPQYDFFQVEQHYDFIAERAWMITRQHFIYFSKSGRAKKSGETLVSYSDFQLQKHFDKNYFGAEISTTAEEAYEKDSSFWQHIRPEPLSEKEMRFIHFRDSLFQATHTRAYLDSIDAVINRITWKKLFIFGQLLHKHETERSLSLPSIVSMYQPFVFGGSRIMPMVNYERTFKSRKNISLFTQVSYGFRNHDINGSFSFTRMYNPFNRGFYNISGGRDFQFIYAGDAWINILKRSNIYLNNAIGIGHGLELFNGLFLYTNIDLAFRRSVSDYKTNNQVDSLLGDILTDNHAIAFEPYNAVYGKIRLQYTPFQRYIREPREKIILGSSWPTFYTSWRKGLPGLFKSKVDFDYLEFGIEQTFKVGLLGLSSYTVKTGSFPNQKDLRLVDYQFQRRGDPLLFLNPNEAFQALDSTFPVFKRFYQAHYLHEFNGALLNKIPFFKKLQLREVGGGGFLIAPERNLRYIEAFAGIERVFKIPFNNLGKFKLGAYIITSAANSFSSPVQFKVGITSWDIRRNKWR